MKRRELIKSVLAAAAVPLVPSMKGSYAAQLPWKPSGDETVPREKLIGCWCFTGGFAAGDSGLISHTEAVKRMTIAAEEIGIILGQGRIGKVCDEPAWLTEAVGKGMARWTTEREMRIKELNARLTQFDTERATDNG